MPITVTANVAVEILTQFVSDEGIRLRQSRTCDVEHHSDDLCAQSANGGCLVHDLSVRFGEKLKFLHEEGSTMSGITLEIAKEHYAKAQAAYEANLANGRSVGELLKVVQYWDAKVQALKRAGRLRTWNVTFRS